MNKKGFTLIEILLVLLIIGLILSIALPNFKRSQLNARVTAHNANVRMLKSATLIYLIEKPESFKEITMDELKPYLEDESSIEIDPIIAKSLNVDKFKIEVDKQGNVNITPGEVYLDGDDIKLKGNGIND